MSITASVTTMPSSGSVHRVYHGILADLEQGRMVPGQRIVETELTERFAVGRNVVREAMQRLAARGVVDLSRHRSPSIRRLDAAETMEVLDVADALTALLLRTAAAQYDADRYEAQLDAVEQELRDAAQNDEPGPFSRARRGFYRALLEIAGNRELLRLFPAVGMHIIYAQYQTRALRGIRLADYQDMLAAIRSGSPDSAAAASHKHVANVRSIVAQALMNETG